MVSKQEIISIHGPPPHSGHAACGCLLTFCGSFYFLLVALVQYEGQQKVRAMACVCGAKPLSYVSQMPSLDGAWHVHGHGHVQTSTSKEPENISQRLSFSALKTSLRYSHLSCVHASFVCNSK
jgi:hypothetical protein